MRSISRLGLGEEEGSASGVLELVAQPVETLVEAVTRGGTGCLEKKVKASIFFFDQITNFFSQSEYLFHLNVPVSVSQAVKAELVRDLCRVHCIWQILLVGEDQQNLRISEIVKTIVHKQKRE